jgi:hypothetical protein
MKKLTYLLFCLSTVAFSFDTNNDLNMGIPISEKTSANKTYENPENNNLPPTADAGPDRAICLNEVTTIGSASNPVYNYEWTSVPTDSSISDPLSSNPNVSPLVTTEYTVTVTDTTNGETAEDSVIVTVNPLPIVDAGSDDTICVGESIQLGAPGQGGFSYAWTSIPTGFTSTLADPIVAPIVTTQYFLTVTNDVTGCQDTADVLITVETPPVIDAGNDDTICEDQSNFTLASASGPSSGVSYQWEALGGDGSFDDSTLLNPTYAMGSNDIIATSVTFRLTAQNINGGCSTTLVQDEVILTIVPDIEASVGVGGVICSTDSFQINATFLNYSSINWTSSGSPGTLSSNAIEDPIYTPSPSDIANGFVDLTVTVSPLSPCTAPFTGEITVNITEGDNLILVTGAGTDAQILCENTPMVQIVYQLLDGATGATVTGLPAGVSYSVQSEIVTILGTPTEDGVTTQTIYTYTITTTGGPCSGTATGTITVNPDDDLSLISAAGTDVQVLCEFEPINDIIYQFSGGATSANIYGLPAGVTFTIIGDLVTISGTPTADMTTQIIYNYTVTTIGTCANASLSGTITVFPEPDIYAGDDEVICESETITLTNAFASNFTSLQWTTSGDGFFVNGGITLVPTYVPGPLDIYGGQEIILTLTVTPIAPCQNVITDSMVLTFVQEPIVDVGPDMTISQGAAVNLNGNVTNASSVLWTFTGGSGTLVNENTLSAVYISDPAEEGPIILTLTAESDCGEVSDSLIININPTPDEELWFLDSNGTGIHRPENTATGIYSIASGYQSEASGDYSTAMGLGASAAGNLSTAMGSNSVAIGDYTTAIGTGNSATGDYSISIGNDNTTAEGEFSLAMGIGTLASGNYSTTMGYYTTASGIYSTSMGEGTTASGEGSTATGLGSIANGGYSTAMGANTTASGFASTALGQDTTASGTYSTAMGINTTATQQGSVAMGADTVADGQEASAFGRATLASGAISTAMGLGTTASANYSTATGYNTTASGVASTAMGDNNTASGFASTSIGGGNTASGGWSTASGQGTTASANYTTAGGYNTTASGVASTVMGDNSTASGFASTAMGGETTASGDWSTSMGLLSVATGQFSTSMGVYTEANGYYSTATGRKTIASDYASTVIGQNNLTGATPTSATNFSLEAPAFCNRKWS